MKITQVLRTQKSITLVLEAKSREDIMDALDAGEYDLPWAEDPAWVTGQSAVEQEATALM